MLKLTAVRDEATGQTESVEYQALIRLTFWGEESLKPIESFDRSSDYDANHNAAFVDILSLELKAFGIAESEILDYRFCHFKGVEPDPLRNGSYYPGIAIAYGKDPNWPRLFEKLRKRYSLTIGEAHIADTAWKYVYMTPKYDWQEPDIWLPIMEVLENARKENAG